MKPAQTHHAAGFTLLELLVALAVLGLIMTGLTGGLRFGVDATTRQNALIGSAGDVGAVDRALRQLIEQMDFGDKIAEQFNQGQPQTLLFFTRLPSAASGKPIQAGLLLDAAHNLVLRWQPNDHVTTLTPPVIATDILLQNVSDLQFSYFSPTSGWQNDWLSVAPPALVRIHFIVRTGSPHSWPDIVVAPIRG